MNGQDDIVDTSVRVLVLCYFDTYPSSGSRSRHPGSLPAIFLSEIQNGKGFVLCTPSFIENQTTESSIWNSFLSQLPDSVLSDIFSAKRLPSHCDPGK